VLLDIGTKIAPRRFDLREKLTFAIDMNITK